MYNSGCYYYSTFRCRHERDQFIDYVMKLTEYVVKGCEKCELYKRVKRND